MMVSQWKQFFSMLPQVASMPPANDPNYLPQDTPCKYVYELSTDLGYHITKPSANKANDKKYINPRNAIRANFSILPAQFVANAHVI